jgi:uncharacterized membrane protein
MLALNIIDRSFSDLLYPLDYNQGAPVGFLILEKAVAQVWNGSEYALRLIPFLSGTISMILFYGLAKRVITPRAVPFALGLFAVSGPLIDYSSTVKQYSSDVLISILLLYLVISNIESTKRTGFQVIMLGIIGASVIWFSHPAVFTLASVGIILTLFSLFRCEWQKLIRLSFAYVLWMLSFAAFYVYSLKNLSNNEVMLNYWKNAFMPFPPLSIADLKWFLSNFFEIFINPVGLFFSGIAALTFIIGIISIYSQKKEKTYILILPIIIVLIVSGFHKYPFSGRLLLFFVPVLILFIAEGMEKIRDKTTHSISFVGLIVISLLFLHPLVIASYHLVKPVKIEEIKPVIRYIDKNKKSGDVIYLYYASEPAYKYYTKTLNIPTKEPIVGISSRNDWGKYNADLDKLQGKGRVWIVFSHVCTWQGVDEEKYFLYYLDGKGKKIESFVGEGASAYLYFL